MAFAGRFLRPIRASFSTLSSTTTTSSSSSSCSRNLFNGNYEQLKTWVKSLEPVVHCRASIFQYKFNIQRRCIQNLGFSGRKLSLGSIFGISVVTGSLSLWPRVTYAIDEEHHVDLWDASDPLEDDPYTCLAFARKFWLPALLVMTLVMSWDHPLTLALKVILTLLSTKPSTLSIYLFVEKLRYQSMRQDPHLYNLKSFYAKKVDVEDYMLLCLANVEYRDRTITLIGILGSWWVLHSAPSFVLDGVPKTERQLKA